MRRSRSRRYAPPQSPAFVCTGTGSGVARGGLLDELRIDACLSGNAANLVERQARREVPLGGL